MEEALKFFELKNVEKMFEDFAYHHLVLQEITFLGDAFYNLTKGIFYIKK